jgi:glutathione peroxidase
MAKSSIVVASGLAVSLGVLSLALARQPADHPAPGQPSVPAAQPKPEKPPVLRNSEHPEGSAYVLGFKMNRIDGSEQDLSAYKGKVVVIVNVASKCGFTSQYAGLEKLYEDKKDQGLVILGFPANNFGGQEPKGNKEIAEFCTGTYKVSFPMFEKISVKGSDQAPLYKKLTEQPAPIGGDPKWNFTKFLVDRNGSVVARFDAERKNAGTANLEAGLLAKVDELLANKN